MARDQRKKTIALLFFRRKDNFILMELRDLFAAIAAFVKDHSAVLALMESHVADFCAFHHSGLDG